MMQSRAKVERMTGKPPPHTHTQICFAMIVRTWYVPKRQAGALTCVLLLRWCHPVDSAGFFSFMTFNWLTPLAMRARRKKQLLLDDVWPVSQRESCNDNSMRWEELMKACIQSLWSVCVCYCETVCPQAVGSLEGRAEVKGHERLSVFSGLGVL